MTDLTKLTAEELLEIRRRLEQLEECEAENEALRESLRKAGEQVQELFRQTLRLEKCEAALKALLDDCEVGGFRIEEQVERQARAALEK